MHGRVLVVAGSDSGGGAGIQADIKTVTALGGYATTAITALTAQDTRGVHGVWPVPPDFVRPQIAVVLDDHRRRRGQDRHAGRRRDDRGGVRRAGAACAPACRWWSIR